MDKRDGVATTADSVCVGPKPVGRENYLASTDCGFARGPFHHCVHPGIMWAKFEAMAEGAKIASKTLWG